MSAHDLPNGAGVSAAAANRTQRIGRADAADRKEGVSDERRRSGRIRRIHAVVLGIVNIIYGFGALDDANIFVNDSRFILSNLNTLGWVLISSGSSSSPPATR